MSNGLPVLILDTIESDKVCQAVFEKLGGVDKLWVAELDLCETWGCVRYETFDNINDLIKNYVGTLYDKHPTLPVFMADEYHLIMSEKVAKQFENFTACFSL